MANTNSTEKWLPIQGYPNYEVSDHGRVKSLNYRCSRNTGRPGILRPGACPKGYLVVVLYLGRQRKSHKVHVLVLEAFVGPRPTGLVCDHRDANRQNNHTSNLHWVTYAENALRGGAHHKAKLDEAQVIQIRKRYALGGITQVDLGEEFGVGGPLVSLIVSRKIWKHC